MHFSHRRLSLAIALLGVNMPLYALDLGSDVFSLRGFGTVGVVHNNTDLGDFRTDDTVPRGSGRSNSTSFSQMTRLGGQLDAKWNDRWSSTAQVVSEYTYQGNYSPYVNNLFIKYEEPSGFSARLGRMVQPFFMLTEFSRVGYAVPWARPPMEVYNSSPMYDGLELVKNFSVSDVALSVRGFYGKGFLKLKTAPENSVATLDAKSTAGMSLTADIGSWSLFGTHIENKIKRLDSPSSDRLLALYRNSGNANAIALADKYDPNKVHAKYDALGVSYDPGQWFLRSEVAKVTFESYVGGTETNSYVTAGYRFGTFTPYFIYGKNKLNSATSAGSADPFGFMNASLASTDDSRHSLSLGMRWDFTKNMDFKLQFSRIEKDTPTSSNGLNNRVSGRPVPESYNAIFAGIDFVF